MKFQESIETCLKQKYADFNGEATRSEYWWFALFVFAGGAVLSTIFRPLAMLFSLGMVLPHFAVGARRLHDTDRSGWWLLISFVPVVGWIILLILLVQPGKTPVTPT